GPPAVRPQRLADGELVGAQRVLRPEVARADAERTAEQARRLGGREPWEAPAELRRLVGLAQRHPDVAGQRVVARHPLVRPLEDDDSLLAAERVYDGRLGERPDDVYVDGADLGVALVPQVVARRLDVVRRASQRHEHGV